MKRKGLWAHVAVGMVVMGIAVGPVGCGLKTKPVPAERVVPRPAGQPTLEVTPQGVRLVFQPPRHNTDGSPLTDLEAMEILRAGGEAVGCPGCPPEFKKVAEVPYVYPERSTTPTGTLEYLDQGLKPGLYHYRILARTKRGFLGQRSAAAQGYWDIPPGAVERLQATAGDGKVELAWGPVGTRADGASMPAGEVGYQVFRAQKGGGFRAAPLNDSPLREPRFLDTTVQNNMVYEYRVRAVRLVKERPVPGAISSTLEATPRRLVAPEPPKGVVAFPTAAGIRVVWEGVEAREVIGYRVFRALGPDGPWELLTREPIPTVLFVDSAVERGRWYWYAVTAMDDAVPPNESRKSEPARVRQTAGEAQEGPAGKPAR